MPLSATGSANTIVAVVSSQPTLTAVFGSVYVASSGGGVTISSPKGTITVGGTLSNPTLDIAQQGAVAGQILMWDGTLLKWVPGNSGGTGTVTSISFAAPASNAFAVATPNTTPAINFQNTGADPSAVFLRGDGQWQSGGVTAQYLYNLIDVNLPDETATSFAVQNTTGINLVTVLTNQITVTQNGAISPATIFPVGQKIASTNTAGSPVFTVASIANYVNNAWRIVFTSNISGWTAPQNPITVYYPTTGAIPDGQVLTWSQTNKYWTNNTNIASITANAGGTAQTGNLKFLAGSNVTLAADTVANTITINATGGGGTGFTVTPIWTGGSASKNAYTSPGVVNNVGITINLVASSGSGGITGATVSLNGVALTNTYVSTGSWPNLTITIPAADLVGNAAEVASSVAISIICTFGGGPINIANAGMLTNIQPTAFSTSLTGSYSISSAPYYTTTANINYAYGPTTGTITFAGGTFTPGGNATLTSGTLTNVAITGSTISGSANGTGLAGAGSSIVNLSGSVAAVPTFIPAFYAQTANSTPPTFTSASSQTSAAAQGSSITYPAASATTQYNWIMTQRPLANLSLVTSFGNNPLNPNVTAPNQTISGQTFAVYGFTELGVGTSAVLQIS